MVSGDDGDYEFGPLVIWVGGTKFRGLLFPPMDVRALATRDRDAHEWP